MDEIFEAAFGIYDLDELAGSNEEDELSLLEWGSTGLQYTGSLVSSDVPSVSFIPEEPEPLVSLRDAFDRSTKSHWQMLPLDEDTAANTQELLAAMTDDELLAVPSHVLVHMQRTFSQGGAQVISPRQVTLGGIAGRVAEKKRQPDMHIVGSNATRNLSWPIAAGYLLTNAWWREPLDAYPNTPAVRSRTSQASVVVHGDKQLDPVEMAVVKSRALIDMQRRPDIGGDAEGLSRALAAAWGIDPELYDDVAGSLIEGSGNLLRYAIGPDKHYPVVHAPVQARKVISVAAMATGRDIYGEHAALDWRRLRVLAEAVFYMSARVEGYTMEDMAQARPVGDPSAPPNRAGLMQFRPMPGAVWTFAPSTFRLSVNRVVGTSNEMILPERLTAILEEQLDTARVTEGGGLVARKVTYAAAQAPAMVSQVGETLVRGFELLKTSAAAFQARGYTADSAVSSFVHSCMVGDRSGMSVEAVWATRAVSEAATALGMAHAIDARMARQVGARLKVLTDDLRQKLVVEAEKQGASLEEWWHDFSSRLPFEIRVTTESNQAWAAGIAWYLMARPSTRWIRLSSALANETHRALASVHLAEMTLPPKVHMEERVREAVTISAARLSRSYGAYYHATADGAYLLAARCARAGDNEGSAVLRAAGRMWDIRAAAAYTMSLTTENPGRSAVEHIETAGMWVRTAPYNAYSRWLEAAAAARLTVGDYPDQVKGHVSDVFKGRGRPLHECWGMGATRVLRYMYQPSLLHRDIEKSLSELSNTLREVADRYMDKSDPNEPSSGSPVAMELHSVKIDMDKFRPAEGSLWDVITQLESYDATWVAETLEDLEDEVQTELEQRRYKSGDQLMSVLTDLVESRQSEKVNETVG